MRLRATTLLIASMFVPAMAQPAADSGTSPANEQSIDYRLGPGDQVEVRIFGLEDHAIIARISNSGKIHLPFLGIVPVAALTPIELEGEIGKRLKERKLMKDPVVQVRITEYRAQPVYILGEVGNPGQYVLYHRKHLMDLITMAGGIADSAREYGFLYRRNSNWTIPAEPVDQAGAGAPPPGGAAEGKPLYSVTKINLRSLLSGKNLEFDLPLRGGDLFYIPAKQQGFFYVVGDVLRTGAFAIPEGEPLLATRGISMAGGPTKTAKMSQGVLVRYDETGQLREIPLDFAAIFKGKEQDFLIEPDDVIFIPGSSAKTIGYGLLGMLPNIAVQTAYSELPFPRGGRSASSNK